MKITTKIIIVLSIVSLLLLGWIIYSTIAGNEALRNAKNETQNAIDENIELKKLNKEGIEINKQLKKEKDDQKIIIDKQNTTIAAMKADNIKEHNIASAAVKEGADLKEIYDSGNPIVDKINVFALSEWYTLLGGKIPPILLSLDNWIIFNAKQEEYIVILEETNTDLLNGNVRMSSIIISDSKIKDEQKDIIDSQKINLDQAYLDIQKAQNAIQLGNILAWTFGILATAEAGYIGGSLLGAW